ncbi:MAG TPA: sugar phosphate isomerase/epimerase family protein [Sedimentisphaerales bacterium]|nr:sugar phosphate isomerase/epimerase family protein [Sedimentisphaerales bacterium]
MKEEEMSEQNGKNTSANPPITRRSMLQRAASAGAGTAMALTLCGRAAGQECSASKNAATKGRIKQSVAYWCFQKYWTVEQTCQIVKDLGCKSVELVEPKDWPMLKKYGLVCALHGSHWFDNGMNNPEYHDMCISKMRKSIDECAEYGFPNVITFTGAAGNISADDGIKNCVAGYKKIIGHAEKNKVNLCLEILNSRVAEDMKGHPGYQGDHTDYCMEIVKKVGSARMKLLFDVYHVQIMDGDIISRIRQYKDYIGHYHTAGNPGRAEIDDTQEVNYKPIMEEIVKTGYTGYVGIEFVPTRDPLEGLRQAVLLCDV